MVRLYCPTGSAIAPDSAGPSTSPVPNADVSTAIPKAWLVLSDDSDNDALRAPPLPWVEKSNEVL